MVKIPPINGGQQPLPEKSKDDGQPGTDVVKVDQMRSAIDSGMKPDASRIGGTVSKTRIEEAGHRPEAHKVKEAQKQSWNFLSAIISFIRTALSYLNIFAYFYKEPKTAAVMSEKIESPAAEGASSPEVLSRAANLLISFLAKDENALKQEGIFRLSGSKVVNDELVKRLTQSSVTLSEEELSKINPNSLTGALKEIFGQMDLFGSPKLTENFLQLGTKINGLSEEEKIAELKKLVGELPEQQQKDLNAMLALLAKITEFKDVNKMAASNLAIVFGPQLVPNLNPVEFMAAFKQINLLTENLITYQKRIFE